MMKTILITGATDGIGRETARKLAREGHHLLLHGRNEAKLDTVIEQLSALPSAGSLERYVADLSRMDEVEALAKAVTQKHTNLDVLINNAGVFKVADPVTSAGLDVRFVVNTLAPYLLTQRLLGSMNGAGRVVNLSSAAQAPVQTQAMVGDERLADFDAYAQSKLALTMWSRYLAERVGDDGPVIVSVNPGSMLATNMVKAAFGVAGNDISIGADILVRAALSSEFADASGQYYDNDAQRFAAPHEDALNEAKCAKVVKVTEALLGL